jgi:protein subunit release factor B
VLRQADGLRTEICPDLSKRADDLVEPSRSSRRRTIPELTAELDRDAQVLAEAYGRERTQLLFSGDTTSARRSASTPGPAERRPPDQPRCPSMYLRWPSDTASPPRSSTRPRVRDRPQKRHGGDRGPLPYGFLRAERGVHRLVRISPYDSQKRRQTTFALVEVLPEVEADDTDIELDWDEIRIDTFRSQGAGGQNVQKTDSAVRLTHLPTGIVAQSQNERSQTQNKETAIKVLKARLLERRLEEKEEELRKLKGEHVVAGWGNQIRSYVLHPYQMVKDLRTGHETSNTGAVLDGDLDAFMQAELERLATGAPIAATDVSA